jgi:hypothetical protein
MGDKRRVKVGSSITRSSATAARMRILLRNIQKKRVFYRLPGQARKENSLLPKHWCPIDKPEGKDIAGCLIQN